MHPGAPAVARVYRGGGPVSIEAGPRLRKPTSRPTGVKASVAMVVLARCTARRPRSPIRGSPRSVVDPDGTLRTHPRGDRQGVRTRHQALGLGHSRAVDRVIPVERIRLGGGDVGIAQRPRQAASRIEDIVIRSILARILRPARPVGRGVGHGLKIRPFEKGPRALEVPQHR
jgi:hypothetical protein